MKIKNWVLFLFVSVLGYGQRKNVRDKEKGRKTPEDIIKRITMNGKVVSNYSISHGEMLKGGALLFHY